MNSAASDSFTLRGFPQNSCPSHPCLPFLSKSPGHTDLAHSGEVRAYYMLSGENGGTSPADQCGKELPVLSPGRDSRGEPLLTSFICICSHLPRLLWLDWGAGQSSGCSKAAPSASEAHWVRCRSGRPSLSPGRGRSVHMTESLCSADLRTPPNEPAPGLSWERSWWEVILWGHKFKLNFSVCLPLKQTSLLWI